MPYLSFGVEADYSELILLQREIVKTQDKLRNFRPGQSGDSFDVLNKKLAESKARFRQLSQTAIRSGAEMEFGMRRSLSNIFTEVYRVQDLLTRPMMAVGGLAGVYGLGEFLSKLTNIRGQFQQMNAAIETMIGKRRGEKLNAELQEFAKKSPLEFAPTVSVAQMMLGFGVEAEKVPKYLQAIGDISLGNTGRFRSLALAFSQMSAAGKLMGQDLLQMVNAGFQPLQIISEKTGKSIGTLREEMSKGKITAKMVQDAFIEATEAGGKYYNMSEIASKTIPGAIAKLNDSMDLMFNDMGKSMEGSLVSIIDVASTVVDNIGKIIPVLATAAAAFGVYKTSVMLSNFAAKQSVLDASKSIIDGFNAELAKIQEMQNAKVMEGYDPDIRKALDDGAIDQTYAKTLQLARLWKKEQENIAENERKIAEEAKRTYEEHLKDMQTKRDNAEPGKGKLDDDIVQGQANGVISEETANRLQNERDYAQAVLDTKKAALDSANTQRAATDRLVASAQKRVDSAKELMEMAEATGDEDDKKAAAQEYLAATEEKAAAITAQQTAFEQVNTAERERNSAEIKLQEIQERTKTIATEGETAAEAANTTAQTANTTATNLNTAATRRGAIATAFATAKDKVMTIGKYALATATKAVKDAFNGLKVAFATNPFGFIITALTTAIGLFMSFKDETEESSAMSERFGESAVKTKNNVDMLYAVLGSVSKDSKVYKDALGELTQTAKEYGLTIKDESKTLDELIAKRTELNSLILKEGEARQIANRIATYQNEKEGFTKDFVDDMKDNIEDESEGNAEKHAQRYAQLIADRVELDIQDKENGVIMGLLDNWDSLEEELFNLQNHIEYDDETGEVSEEWKNKKKNVISQIAEVQRQIAGAANKSAKDIAEAMGEGDDYKLDVKDVAKAVKEYAHQIKETDKFIDGATKKAKKLKDEQEAIKGETPTDYTKMDDKKLAESLVNTSKEIDEINSKPIKPLTDPINIHALFVKARQTSDKMDEINDKPVAPKTDSSNIGALFDSTQEAKEGVDALGISFAAPQTDNSHLDETTAKGEEAKGKVDEIDNSSATPYIDTKYLDIALSTLDNIKLRLREVGGNVVNLNTTKAERDKLQELMNKYGKDGKFTADMITSEKDKEEYKKIMLAARRRSNFRFGGQTYNLNAEQSAIMEQFIQRYGLELSPNKMSESDRRLYEQMKNDLLVDAYNKKKGDKTAELQKIKDSWDNKISSAKTTEDFDNLRKQLNALLRKTEQGSADYKYIESLIKKIDKRDKSKKKDKDDPKQREYEIEKKKREEELLAEERALAERDRLTQLSLDKRRDSSEKEIDVIKFEAKKKRDALEKERRKEIERLKEYDRTLWLKEKKGRKAYQWKQTKSDAEYQIAADANIGYETQKEAIDLSETQKLQSQYKEIAQAMQGYLKEYGTFQQRQYAIEQEYAEKILNARNEGEKRTLEAQKKAELQKLDIDAIKQQIDWGSMFGDFGSMLSDQVQPTIEKLEAITKTEDFRASSFDEQKAVYELITTLKGSLTKWDSDIYSTLGDAVTEYQTALRNNIEAVEAESQARTVAEEKASALREIEGKNRQARETGGKVDTKAEDNARSKSEKAVNALGEAAAYTQQTTTNLANAQQKLTNATTTATGMFNTLVSGMQGLSSGSLQGVWDGLNKLSNLFSSKDNKDSLAKSLGEPLLKGVQKLFGNDSKVGKSVSTALSSLGGSMMGEIVSAAFAVLDILKNGIGNFIASLIDTVLGAVNGLLNSVLSGELITSVGKSIIEGVGSILDTISFGGFSSVMNKLGLSGESDKNLERDIERLTASNEALRNAIDSLAEEMQDAATADMGALYEQQVADIKQAMKNTREMMSRSGAAYTSGTFGIGGKHSSNKKIDKEMSGSDWSRISGIVGKTVRGAGDFWELTSEQMAKVAEKAPDLYAKIKGLADDGYKDAAQYMDDYISYYKELEDLENAFRESLTDVSFDSVKDEFKSMLLDMESSTEDFADNFEKMMQQAVINSLMNSKYNDMIKKWYEDFSDAMNDDNGLTTAEQERLKKEWDNIVGAAVVDRDNLKKTMGWDGSETQQSSSRSVSGMSQDTGNAIEGRLTALQIAVESIRTHEAQHTLSIADMNDELLGIAMEYNRFNLHQDNIERQLAKIYIELQTISENTGAIVKPIQSMQLDIAEIKKNTKKL